MVLLRVYTGPRIVFTKRFHEFEPTVCIHTLHKPGYVCEIWDTRPVLVGLQSKLELHDRDAVKTFLQLFWDLNGLLLAEHNLYQNPRFSRQKVALNFIHSLCYYWLFINRVLYIISLINELSVKFNSILFPMLSKNFTEVVTGSCDFNVYYSSFLSP